MLTDSLRGLERDGFVERSVYAEVPVRVEYLMTTLGWAATELLMTLAEWADELWGSESRSSRVAVLMDESAEAVASFQVV
jgi:DNA-binding HxlR family transcriptional regulator